MDSASCCVRCSPTYEPARVNQKETGEEMIKLMAHIALGIESFVDFVGFKKLVAGLIVIGFLIAWLGPVIVRAL
jgi:hypothetical protein